MLQQMELSLQETYSLVEKATHKCFHENFVYSFLYISWLDGKPREHRK